MLQVSKQEHYKKMCKMSKVDNKDTERRAFIGSIEHISTIFSGVHIAEFTQVNVFLSKSLKMLPRKFLEKITISTSPLVTVSVLICSNLLPTSSNYEKLLLKIPNYIDLAFVLEVRKRRATDHSFIYNKINSVNGFQTNAT